jgi:hypothetical protein
MILSEFNKGQLNIFFIAMGATIIYIRDYWIIGIFFIIVGFAIIAFQKKEVK